MKLAVFSTKQYTRYFMDEANKHYKHSITYFEPRLNEETVGLAAGYEAICPFVNDTLNAQVLDKLAENGTKLIALRSAGFNNVDVERAIDNGMTIARVPAYSPNSVAEHTIALIMTLNRKVCRAFTRVREGNFALDGLLGFDVFTKTVGIVGTGKIGSLVAKIMLGFGCEVIAYDLNVNQELADMGVQYESMEDLFARSDIITLHCPLTRNTYHMINPDTLARMKDGVMLINTSRGAIIDTSAVIESLKSGKLGYLGLDVYEEEENLFFEDLSNQVIQDDVFARLLWFPNVIITGHLAFFTINALRNISETTLENVSCYERRGTCTNLVTMDLIRKQPMPVG